MHGPFANEYWEAVCPDVETLENMKSWDVVDHGTSMYVLSSIWVFKCKRHQYGLIKKFNASLCTRGDQHIKGVDYFETYAPIVMWTIR